MNATLTRTSDRATARTARTLYDDLAMPSDTGYGRGDPCGRSGFAGNRSISTFHNTTQTPAPQDLFATTPMQAVWREPDRQREEEAYTSFEAAISNRVLALKERHISARMQTAAYGGAPSALDRLVNTAFTTWHNACARGLWKRGLLLLGVALMLILVGFDLMGLLVLYAR